MADLAKSLSGGGGVALSNAVPNSTGLASAGVALAASRSDHVHAGGGGGTAVGTLSASLASLAGTDDGQIAVIIGRSAAGDGDCGFARWHAGSSTTADNALVWGAGSGRWKRIITNATVEAAWWGFGESSSASVNRAALQAAINASKFNIASPYLNMGGKVLLPPGVCNIDAGITWSGVRGLVLEGAANGTTVLRYQGNSNLTLDLISFDGVNCQINKLTIRAETKIRSAITCTSGSADSWISSSNTFTDVVIGGFNLDQFLYGFRFTQGAVGDNNNDLHRFYRVSVSAYTEYAFYVHGSQVHGLWFESCQMFGLATGTNAKGGIWCEYGSYIHWNGGSGGYHSEQDFFFQNFFHHTTIRGWNSEQSVRLAKLGNASSAPFPVDIVSCRFASAVIAADEEGIVIASGGPTKISGCNFYTTNGRFMIRNDGYANEQTVIVQGNAFTADVAYPTVSTQAVEGENTFYRRGALKGQNPQLWQVIDGGNMYRNLSVGDGVPVHRIFPNHIGLRGISATSTPSTNLGGTVNFIQDDTSKSVVFSAISPGIVGGHNLNFAEPDALYKVVATVEVTLGSPTAKVATVSSKSATGFTLTLDAAVGVGQTISVHWLIFRA